MRVTYEPGGMLTIVADDGIAVLPGGLPQELIDDVWVGLDSGDGVAAVLDAMARAFGPATAASPPFAVALLQGDAVRTAVRGDLRLTVETLGGPLEVPGGGDAWTVRLVEDALSVRVRPPQDAPARASELPIASGAVLAATVRAVFFEAEDDDEPARAQGDAHVPNDLVSGDPDADPSADAPTETLLPDDTRLVGADEAPAEAHADDDPADALAAADTVAVERELPVDTLEPQASGPITPLGDHDGATISAAHLEALHGHVPPPPDEPPVDVRLSEPDPVVPVVEAHGDHDGATIAVGPPGHEDAAPRGASVTAEVPIEPEIPRQAESPDPSVGPRLDPAPVPRFDVPALPEPGGSPFAPGPSRGWIRLSTGETIELVRPVIVGRRPRSTRTAGADVPQLVAVESPQNDISRNHIEIGSDGETVVVTDLHTTNGTVLYRSGLLGASADPVRLHPGEQTVVVSGDVVDIGDGIRITFEDLP
ncbi:FHA domain-containing protein [Microbacterium rhizophilus]|uniref:FHA domain-containing protein n=1 Tax=Microbacterium rhizophilus TaxID=3138934 RepID=UPI0031EF0CD5